VWTNAIGVRTFTSPVLYTTLKNAFVGVALLIPLLLSARYRAEYRELRWRDWGVLLALAVTGGSFAFVLEFTGLRMTTASTASLIGHFQYVLVGVIAIMFLGERLKPAMWAGFGVLFLGLLLASGLGALEWNQGALLVGLATIMYAVSWVIAKLLLRGKSTLMVFTALMTMGVLMLVVYTAATGQFAELGKLGFTQWRFILIVGAILLVNNGVTLTAIRHAPVAAVMAIGTSAPIVTTLLQVGTTGALHVTILDGVGLALLLLAAASLLVMGVRSEVHVPSPHGAPS
jgi:drug/metabolite transporter (DMT)-like permease